MRLTVVPCSVQVNLPAETGEMGVLANHVPSIEQLKPGLVEVIEEAGGSKQFFLSGGFAVVQPGSQLSINAVEGYPLEDFSADVSILSAVVDIRSIADHRNRPSGARSQRPRRLPMEAAANRTLLRPRSNSR
jgi:F0F1-type ATP synthase epsilon subunit